MLKKITANNKIWLAITVLLFIGGFFWGFCLRDFLWFARCGAIIVAVGLFFLSRASVIGEDLKLNVISEDTGMRALLQKTEQVEVTLEKIDLDL